MMHLKIINDLQLRKSYISGTFSEFSVMPVFSEDLLEDFLIDNVSISASKVSLLMELNQGTCESHLQVLLAKIRG